VSIALRFRQNIGGNSFAGTVLHHQPRWRPREDAPQEFELLGLSTDRII
jgi:hypothetical protein